MKQEFLSMD